MKWSDTEFCNKLADKIDFAINSGYIITADELKSVVVIDTDDGTKGRHVIHKFVNAELLVPEGTIEYDQGEEQVNLEWAPIRFTEADNSQSM